MRAACGRPAGGRGAATRRQGATTEIDGRAVLGYIEYRPEAVTRSYVGPDFVVREKQLRRGSILEVRVHPDDLGKVIGRGGRTATAFRTVISALAGKGGARIDFVDVDKRR